MSLISELVKKKKELRSSETLITSVTGRRYLEKRADSGELEKVELAETSAGFVVDEKLDLQVVQILPYLYLSSQDPAQDSGVLKNYGITHVLSIEVDIPEILRSERVKYTTVKLLDEPEADLKKVLQFCFEIIDKARMKDSENKVLVHCNAGYSRSPSVVIAYLMKTFGYSLNVALNIVKVKRNIKPNEGFLKQLKDFEPTLRGQDK